MSHESPKLQCLKRAEELFPHNRDELVRAGILERYTTEISDFTDGTIRCVFSFDPNGCQRSLPLCAGRKAVGACLEDLITDKAMEIVRQDGPAQT